MAYLFKASAVTSVLIDTWYDVRRGSFGIERPSFTYDDGDNMYNPADDPLGATAYYDFISRDGTHHTGPITAVRGYTYRPDAL